MSPFEGDGEIVFESDSPTTGTYTRITATSGTQLTIGPGQVVHGGTGRITGPGSFVNRGVIQSDVADRFITVKDTTLANTTSGVLRASAGQLVLENSIVTNDGMAEAIGASLRMTRTTMFVNGLSGGIRASGADSTVEIGSDVTLDNSGLIESVGGSTILVSSRFFINQASGSLSVGAGSTLHFQEGLMCDGGIDLVDGGELFVDRDFTLGVNAWIKGQQGTVTLTGHFNNASEDSALFDASGITMHMDGAAAIGTPQLFEAASTNVGASMDGFITNFAVDRLRINSGNAMFVDARDNWPSTSEADAVYVRTLEVAPGATLMLNGIDVYCETLDDQGTIDGDTLHVIGR